MTSSSQIRRKRLRLFRSAHALRRSTLSSILKAGAVLAALGLAGCIADNPEDSDLPWASNKGWEGIAPIAPTMMDRYE